MGDNVRRFNWYWWPVTVFVLAIWVATLGNIQYKCEIGSVQQLDTGYCASWAASRFTSDTLKANAALDVLSDLMKQTKKKPVFTPTDTYYQRLASRMKSRQTKKSLESDLYNLSVVSVEVPKHTFDNRMSDLIDPYLCVSESHTYIPNLVPGELEPRVICYASEVRTADIEAAEGQITREREYQVTRQWA
ncbi:hypothetical protein N0V93_002580 [Gnomoniopsis smithogilvyi]|uniref:Uncharacterized protein n=1 Tax=Gnomoniopsis smithogilvyi TaxID=1191159 RepID=A0A9W9CZ46_9PEZI|nr:hypothetical protein N0V93_002580 [Gnomoniopsis smithogilvyi]